MIDRIDYIKIETLLTEKENKEKEIEQIKARYMALEEPQKPNVVETPDQWNNYVADREKYKDILSELVKLHDSAKLIVEKIPKQIIELIPPNTWVKVGDRYFGYNTDSWPMYQPTLRVALSEDELTILKHNNS